MRAKYLNILRMGGDVNGCNPQVCVALVRDCQKPHLAMDVNESITNLIRDKANRFDDIQHILFRYFMVLGTPDEKGWFEASPRQHSTKRR